MPITGEQVDRVSSDGSATTVAGFNTTIYSNSGNPAQQAIEKFLRARFRRRVATDLVNQEGIRRVSNIGAASAPRL
jgi:hypothetical protein